MKKLKSNALKFPMEMRNHYTGICSYIYYNRSVFDTATDSIQLLNLISDYRNITGNRDSFIGPACDWRDPNRLALIDFMIKELEVES